MYENNFAFYLFLTGLLFLTFFFLISILGFIVLYLIKLLINRKKEEIEGEKKRFSFIEQFFVSFVIGISVYISYCYFLDIFSLFNFFTAYLSIVILDGCFLFLYYLKKKDKLTEKININLCKERLKTYFSDKNNIISFGALILVIILSVIIQLIVIGDGDGLIYSDPYKWYTDTFYLLDNGHINYSHLDYNYPSGHTYFNAGVLLPFPDYIFGFYYFKFISIYFLSLYIIVAFVIVKKLFNKGYLVFLSLFFIIMSRYFIARTMLYVSSSLASLILIIAIIMIINKYPDYLMGFVIAALYFVHNLTTFYFIFVLVLYYLFRFFLYAKNKKLFLKLLINSLISIVILIILLIPYIVGIYLLYNDTLFDFIEHFFGRFGEYEASVILNIPLLDLVYPLDSFKPFIDIKIIEIFDELFERSIYLFFLFTIFGLFTHIKPKRSNKDIEKLAFFKICVLVILIFFFLPYFVYSMAFFVKFRKRILQSFSLPLIIMAVYAIEWIINKSKLLTAYLSNRFSFYKKLVRSQKFYSKFIRIESIFVFFLIISASSTYYTHRYPDYDYQYDDELVEVVLHLRDNAEKGAKILRKEYDKAIIFRMLYDMEVREWDLNENSTYAALMLEIINREVDYLIFPKEYFNDVNIELIISYDPFFDEKMENDDYILYEIQD